MEAGSQSAHADRRETLFLAGEIPPLSIEYSWLATRCPATSCGGVTVGPAGVPNGRRPRGELDLAPTSSLRPAKKPRWKFGCSTVSSRIPCFSPALETAPFFLAQRGLAEMLTSSGAGFRELRTLRG